MKTEKVLPNFIGQILSMVLNIALPIFLARKLSVADFGIYSQIMLASTVAIVFFGLGISTELYYFESEGDSRKSEMALNAFIMLNIMSIASMASLYFLSYFGILSWSAFIGDRAVIISIVVISLLIPVNIVSVLSVISRDSSMLMIFPPLVVLVKVVSIAIFYLYDKTVIGVIDGLLFSSLIVYILSVMYLKKYISTKKNLSVFSTDWRVVKMQLTYVFPLGAAGVVKVLSEQFEKLMLMSQVSPGEYAKYAVCLIGVPGVLQLYSAYSQSTILNMTREIKNNDHQSALKLYKDMVARIVYISVPCMGYFFVNADGIIDLVFGSNFSGVGNIYRMYIIVLLLSILGNGLIIRSVGNTRLVFLSHITGVIISLPVGYALIIEYGIYGAGLTAILVSVVVRSLLIYNDAKIIKIKIGDVLPYIRISLILIVSLSVALIVTFLNSDVNANSYFLTVFSFAAHLLIVYTSLYFIGVYESFTIGKTSI